MKVGLYQVIKLSEVHALDLNWDDLNEEWYIEFRDTCFYVQGDYHELYAWSEATYTFLLVEESDEFGHAYLKAFKPE